MRLKIGFMVFVGVLLGMGEVSAEKLRMKRVRFEYLREECFQRISEYFTGVENRGWEYVDRTDSCDRSGMYFIIRLDCGVKRLFGGCRVVLRYVRSDCEEVFEKVFPVKSRGGQAIELYLGLTGRDWPCKAAKVVAYSVSIVDENGCCVACKESFLW